MVVLTHVTFALQRKKKRQKKKKKLHPKPNILSHSWSSYDYKLFMIATNLAASTLLYKLAFYFALTRFAPWHAIKLLFFRDMQWNFSLCFCATMAGINTLYTLVNFVLLAALLDNYKQGFPDMAWKLFTCPFSICTTPDFLENKHLGLHLALQIVAPFPE